jgi:hypothetical protein
MGNKYDLSSLVEQLEKSGDVGGGSEKEYQSDSWKPTLEKGEDVAEYTIRFLPNPDSDGMMPFVRRDAHMFNFPNDKFIYAPCHKKHNKDEKCFICEEVNKLYASKDPTQEKLGGKRFAKQRYFHNVLIVSDPRDNGKNEGKVMIFECGQQIFNKCSAILKDPELEPVERLYFHPIAGTDFKLKIVRKSGFPNYEESKFARKPSPLEIDGEVLEADEVEKFIEDKCIALNDRLFGEKTFKSYEELKDLYLNQGVPSESKPNTSVSKDDEVEETVDETIKEEKVEVRNPTEKVKVEKEVEKTDPLPSVDEDEDEDAELAALLG